MNKNDDFEFLTLLTGMCEIFDKKCSEGFIELYRAAFEKYSISDFRKAVNIACKQLRFFPKPVELIELIEGNLGDQAEMEAYKVVAQIRQVGAYDTPKLEDPITKVVMTKRFRWGQVCMTPEKDLKWFIKDFVDAYRNYEFGPEQVEYMSNSKLLGLCNQIGSKGANGGIIRSKSKEIIVGV